MNLSFGSLFSGVGGMDLGFLRNDWECKWMVEFDKNAAGVLAHHYPDVPLHCDVEKVDADELEVPDVVLAGFPCQDVSQAGLRKGLHEGTRSSLLWNAIRIIQRLRARGNLRYALFENVPGLFSIDNGLGFARCIRIDGTGRKRRGVVYLRWKKGAIRPSTQEKNLYMRVFRRYWRSNRKRNILFLLAHVEEY